MQRATTHHNMNNTHSLTMALMMLLLLTLSCGSRVSAFGWINTRLTAAKGQENFIEVEGKKVALGIPGTIHFKIIRYITIINNN